MEDAINTQNNVQYIDSAQNFREAGTEILVENEISIVNKCDIELYLNKTINVTETQLSQNVSDVQETNQMEEDEGKNSDGNNDNDESSIEVSNKFELHNIKVPIYKRRARSAGSDITVIGIPKRRKKTNKLVPFSKKPTKERLDTLFK